MKIALIVPGGVDRSGEYRVIPALMTLIERLGRAHQVHVFALNQEARAAHWRVPGASVVNIGRPFTIARTFCAVRREHTRGPFDLVHVMWAGAGALAGVAAAKSLAVPSLLHLAGGELTALPDIDYGGQLLWHRRIVDGWCLRNAACVTGASAPIIRLGAGCGVEVVRVPLGVDLAQWPAVPPRPRGAGERVRLIHVASLNRVKDQPTLLRAMRRLEDAGVDFHLDIIGADTLGGAMERLVTELGISGRVTFFGFRTQRELRAFMARAHIQIVSSRHEAGPLVLLEAAVMGVPTVGTDVGHINEWANDAAIRVPVGDDAALAAGVRRLIDDDAERLRLAAQAQRRAILEDADFTLLRFEQCYARIVKTLPAADAVAR